MAALKIWGRKTSSNVQKVLWCCDELGIPYERIDIGGPFGGNDEPKYRAMNPTGLIPTVQDGKLVLWESNTILRYLARKHGGGLYPETLEEAALAERWMDWQLAHIGPVFSPIFMGFVRTPPEKRDMKAIEAARQRTVEHWRMVEAHLAGKSYMNGQRFSLADIPLGIIAYRWFTLPVERPDFPNVARWYARLQERKPFKTHVMIPLA
jgi:glutathione S-transferase